MVEWVGDNLWALWLTLAVVFAVVEVFILDLVFLMLAVGAAAAVVAVVSVPGALELVVLPGGPATANWPPRRNDGGPLCVICQPMTPAAMNAPISLAQ